MQAEAVIVNLSATYKSRDIYSYDPRVDTVASQIAQLANKYSSSRWNCCDCGFFQPTRLINALWVVQLYLNNCSTVINPYRLGSISTEDFMRRFVQAFKFLLSANYPEHVISSLYNRRQEFVTLPLDLTIGQLRADKRLIAQALLEDAWNSLIPEFDEETKTRWRLLASLAASGKKIYLISNSNQLNIRRVLNLLQRAFPSLGDLSGIDIAMRFDDNPIAIANNVYLCVSYRMRAFKTPDEQQKYLPGTPGLLQKLLQQQLSGKAVEVISQYSKDLEAAQKFGIPRQRCHLGEQVFVGIQQQQQQTKKSQ